MDTTFDKFKNQNKKIGGYVAPPYKLIRLGSAFIQKEKVSVILQSAFNFMSVVHNYIRYCFLSMDRKESTEALPSIAKLRATYNDLKKKLGETSGQPSLEVRKQEIMNLLHEFNDVKDAAQIVIGALANMEGKTIKEIHINYNLPTIE